MSSQRPGEARLEVSLAQAIINEVKFGSETSQLAEVSLLAAFQNRAVGEKLVHALRVLMPGLLYLSIGALLKDGVIVRTSNLVTPGPVEVGAQTLRGSAARIAARKHSAYHVTRRPEDSMASKYYELQEAWDQAGAHSVLTVPIPAVRAYESASIPEAPGNAEETACDPASHVCQVLHNLNGTVGIMTIGLSTEEIDLHGRQGKAFDAMAQSLSPFLAYYAAPVLEELHGKIAAVAHANASLVAKFKARHQHAKQPPHSGDRQASTNSTKQDSANDRPRGGAIVSPFSAASYPETMQHSSELPPDTAPAPTPQARTASVRARNPFAQAGRMAFSHSTEKHLPHEPKGLQAVQSGPQKQPVSPFAAAAEASEGAPSAFADHSQVQDSPSEHSQASTEHSQGAHLQHGGANVGPGPHSEPHSGSVGDHASVQSLSSSEEIAPDDMEQEQQGSRNSLENTFVFKRTPGVSSVHVRRYSTSTFFQGMLHTPKDHFSHLSSLSTMASINEKAAQEQPQQQEEESQQQQQSVLVMDNSYVTVAHQMNRRALSTPQGFDPAGVTLEAAKLPAQMQAHGSCPDPLLHAKSSSGPVAMAVASAVNAHLAAQQQLSKSGQQGVVFEQTAHVGSSVSGLSASAQKGDSWFSQQSEHLPGLATGKRLSHVGFPEFEETDSISEHSGVTTNKAHSAVQHPIWMTFLEPQLEARFQMWMGQRCSKVDTIFLLAATVYITQLLFYTWALADQQAKKWPLLGYAMLPVLLLQHGDTAWYVKNRSVIVTTVRCVLLVFLILLVPAIVEGSTEQPSCSSWIDLSGMWPLAAISMGLLVRFKVHVVIHAVSCACLVLQGLRKCMAEPNSFKLGCNISSVEKLAAVTCIPTMLLCGIEMRARKMYLQTTKL